MNGMLLLQQQLRLLDKLALEFYWSSDELSETKLIGHQLVTVFDTDTVSVTVGIDLDDPSASALMVKIDQKETGFELTQENLVKAQSLLENIRNHLLRVTDDKIIVASTQQ